MHMFYAYKVTIPWDPSPGSDISCPSSSLLGVNTLVRGCASTLQMLPLCC